MQAALRIAIVALGLIGAVSAHANVPHAAGAQAVASATILHPATLRIDPRLQRPTLWRGDDTAPVLARKTLRPCDTLGTARCTLIVYDLP